MVSRRVCCLVGSPRRNGNSSLMAQAAAKGARAAGEEAEVLFVDDFVGGFLRDCRTCRDAGGNCTIDDRYAELLMDFVMPADGVIIASPIYWYALPGQIKTMIDRLVCFTSARYSQSADVVERLKGKRYALLLSAEESNPGMDVGIIQQIGDFAHYTGGCLVSVIKGAANARGEIRQDPSRPLVRAEAVGRDLFEIRATRYRIDTQRRSAVWQQGEAR